MKNASLFAFLIALAIQLAAQQPAADFKNFNPRFEVFTLPGGFFGNSVQDIVQDSTGFLWFASQGGLHRCDGQNIITYNNDPNNLAILDSISVSPSTGTNDFNVDGAICLRNLYTGNDAAAQRVQSGITEVKRAANLHGKPAIIVHGRADTNTPPANTSRPYFGANKIVEGAASKLSYIEVINAQHLDTFISAFAGYDTRFVPIHRYFGQAMDMMYANLKNGTPLPGSQVVRAVPRGGTAGAAPQITAANVPPIVATPAAADAITFANNTVTIPN